MIAYRTTDRALVKYVLEHTGEKPTEEEIDRAMLVQICLALYEDNIEGLIGFRPINDVTFEIHISMLRVGVGRDAVSEALTWVFSNTSCRKVVGNIPSDRKDVINLAKKCGFEYEGTMRNAVMNNNKYNDLVIYGVDKCRS